MGQYKDSNKIERTILRAEVATRQAGQFLELRIIQNMKERVMRVVRAGEKGDLL
jgi:hypothetical protein